MRNANHHIISRLAAGETVAFFPEGTTSDGHDVLPFHASLFAAAIRDHAIDKPPFPLLPIAIRYDRCGERTLIPAYTGDQSLVDSIIRILSSQGISVRLCVLEEIAHVPFEMTRHALASRSHEVIRAAIQSAPCAAPSILD